MDVIPGLLLALIVPLLFLGLVRRFDFYQTGQFHIIMKCLFLGGITFAPATFIFWILVKFWLGNPDTITHYAAPIYEEILKGIILIYLVKRAKITYSVDGAMYGFAIGTGFAIVENLVYMNHDPSVATMVVAQRIFSANLVHAFSSATVGITLVMIRSRSFKLRWQIPILGFFLAICQHLIFNNLSGGEIASFIYYLPIIPGILFIIYVMQRGKKDARKWIIEKLERDSHVTRGEVALVDSLAEPNDILFPVVKRFGVEKAELVEKLLYQQARIGINRKALDNFQVSDPVRNDLDAEIGKMHMEMKKTQREIGTYAMLFVRGLYTDEMVSVWDRMQAKVRDRSVVNHGRKGGGLWSILDERVK